MKSYLVHFQDDDSKRISKAQNRKEAERNIESAYPARRFWLFELMPKEVADWTTQLEAK